MSLGVYGCMQMTPRLKYALPLLQVAIALWLIQLGMQQERRLEEVWDVAYAAPAWHLADAMNAPFRPLWRACNLFRQSWNVYVALGLVAALWLRSVGNASTLLKTGRIAMPEWLPLRLTIDVVLFIDGAYCGSLGYECLAWVCRYGNWTHSHYSHLTPAEWMMELATGLCYITWAILLIAFFGRDVVQSVRARMYSNRPEASVSLQNNS